jgi:multiple sugar transport system permease protein
MANSTTTATTPLVDRKGTGSRSDRFLTYKDGSWWLTHTALLLISIGFLLPLVWMISTSLKQTEHVMDFPPTFIPNPINWNSYHEVVTNPKMTFPLFARNTLIIAVLAVMGQVLSSSLVAYGFAKINFKGRGWLFGVMLATMMLPFPVTMVPLFCIYRWLGDLHIGSWQVLGQWLGTFKPLWVPAWFGSAFSVFLLRQFYMTIPKELSEAARLDGCSEFGIYWRVILPLSRPALAVIALFTFMGAWKDFLGPLIYLTNQSQYTLSLGLQTLQSAHGGTPWNALMAASVMVVAPVILLFFVVQEQFIQGIATTGMKG